VSDLPTLLPACEGWEDQLWAHVAARLEARIDERWHELGGFWETEDPQTDDERTAHGGLAEVFASIAAQSGPIADASRNPLYVTQKQVLLGHSAEHLDAFADRLPSLAQAVPDGLIGPLLRFFAHLVLVLRTLGQDVPESAANAILESYLRVLERGGHSSLVAPYAACLREGNGEESYARFLRSMPPTASLADKRTALLRARDYGLDVATIATYTVRMILHAAFDAAPSLAPGQPDITDGRVGLSADDEALIRALEWLTIVPETLPEALARANEVARYFLATGQAHAAGALLHSLPEEVGVGAADDETEFADYGRLFAVFDAHDGADEVAAAQPKETASKVELHAWAKRLLASIEHVADLTRDLLTSRWLAFPIAATGKQASARRRELRRIRQIFVPDLVMRLHVLLVEHHTRFPQLLQAALDMTVLVASQEHGVYEEFIGRDADASRLVAYLEHVREASMSALAAGSADPFRAP
jgi:nuclear pore complex protein Nup107